MGGRSLRKHEDDGKAVKGYIGSRGPGCASTLRKNVAGCFRTRIALAVAAVQQPTASEAGCYQVSNSHISASLAAARVWLSHVAVLLPHFR